MGGVKTLAFVDDIIDKVEVYEILWDGNTDGKKSFFNSDVEMIYYKVSDDVPSFENLTSNTISLYAYNTANGETVPLFEDGPGSEIEMWDGAVSLAGFCIILYQDINEIETGMSAEKGIYFAATLDGGYVSKLSFTNPIYFKSIKQKYLPQFTDSIVLRSSTKGSNKKFRLTIDDSGQFSVKQI